MPVIKEYVPKANKVSAIQNIGGIESQTIQAYESFTGIKGITVEPGGLVKIPVAGDTMTVPVGSHLVIENELLVVYPDGFMKEKYKAL